MRQYSDSVTDSGSQGISGATVTVYNQGTSTKSTLYSDDGVTTTANPVTTAANGSYSFYIADGTYDFVIAKTGYETVYLDNIVVEQSALERLASTSTVSDGDALVACKRTDTGAVEFTLHEYNENRPINVKTDFGAVGDGVTDDYLKLQSAVTTAVSSGKSLYIPEGNYFTSAKIVATNNITVFGDGYSSSRLYSLDLDDAIFEVETTGTIDDAKTKISKIGFLARFTGGSGTDVAPLANNCGILLSGDNTDFLQYITISHVLLSGCYAGIKNTKAARTTGFGLENNVDWALFSDIHINNFTHQTKYGFWFTTGSGTGNSWSGIKAKVHQTGSVFRFEGTDHVVGDIVILNAHMASSGTGGSGISIGDNTKYRSNILMNGCQVDAGLTTPISLSSTGSVNYNNIKTLACNFGGGTDLLSGLTYLSKSVITDRDVSEIKTGITKTTNSIGANALDFCSLEIGNSQNSVVIEFFVNGLNGGVSSGGCKYVFIVHAAASTITVATAFNYSTPASGFIISSSTSGMTATFTLNFTSTSTGSNVDIQVVARGQKCKLLKL